MFLESKKENDPLKYLLLYAKNGSSEGWGHVCINENMPKDQLMKLADSVCRQLGYTNNKQITTVPETE